MPIGRDGDGERTGFSDFSVRATKCQASTLPVRRDLIPDNSLLSAEPPPAHQRRWNTRATMHRVGRSEEEKIMSRNNWKVGLRAKLEHLVDDCVVAGARQQDVFDAIIREIGNLRAALERDPDPADDDVAVIEEPSNDWPAADK